MERKVYIKKRERIARGVLQKFEDLPLEKQEIFKQIKKGLSEIINEDAIVFVYGSYHHGYWDEESDFDVIMMNTCNIPNLDILFLEKYGIKTNIFFNDKELSTILIP